MKRLKFQRLTEIYLLPQISHSFRFGLKAVVVMLEYFSSLFDVRKTYTEKEVNALLSQVADDFVKVRRYMVEYGYLGRRPDGSAYWSRA